jgi:hypothetical protein
MAVTVHRLESIPTGLEDEGDRWAQLAGRKRNKGRDGSVERYKKAGGWKER